LGTQASLLSRQKRWIVPHQSRGWDDFPIYQRLVEEYTTRNMSLLSDILNAFSAVMAALTQRFDWAFTFGLPDKVIDLALLWTPVDELQPRETSKSFPSWSWAGWLGKVHFKDMFAPLALYSVHEIFRTSTTLEFLKLPQYPAFLKISAETVRASSFLFRKPNRRLRRPYYDGFVSRNTWFIKDKSNPRFYRRCGILYACQDMDSMWNNSCDEVKLVLLSCWQRANSMTQYGPVISLWDEPNLRTDDEPLFEPAFDSKEWSTYNFLLIQKSGNFWKRIGSGQINDIAWDMTRPPKRSQDFLLI
jgi:hypothetical protein